MEDGQVGASELAEKRAKRHASRTGQTYRAFLRRLCDESGMEPDQAEAAMVSVLGMLEQRLRPEEAAHLEAQLPLELRELLPPLERTRKPVKHKAPDFVRGVCEDLGLAAEDGEWAVRSVFQAVRNQVSEGEVAKITRQLPAGLRAFWQPAM